MEPTDQYGVASNIASDSADVLVVDVAANDSHPPLLSAVAYESLREPSEAIASNVECHSGAAGRAVDLFLATAMLLFVLPLMALCAVAVLLSGPGPILYRQARIGRGGEEFKCLKFRTMVNEADRAIPEILRKSPQWAEQWEGVQKLTYDPRVTPVGRFLRRYCLDELPQLFNILAGEMSVVGPRPIVTDEIKRYGPNFADYCSVKPGLTGLWQVSGRHALSYTERVHFDTEYARSKSVRLDLLILLRTVPIVLLGENM
jgi:lipopolysaccharide/colanic/teichoic acid biosynthesis glycosyltransferase